MGRKIIVFNRILEYSPGIGIAPSVVAERCPQAFSRMEPLKLLRLTQTWTVIALAGTCSAHVPTQTTSQPLTPALVMRERQLWKSPARGSEFAAVQRVIARASCEVTRPPEALATPDPLLMPSSEAKVTVSFIIGTDGRIHSPLILESESSTEDSVVLQAVSAWRYRPATCNGVPTEAEGKIDFYAR